MMLARLEDFCDAEVPQIADAIGQDFWNEATLVERRNIAEFLVAKVTLYVDRFELEIKADGISAFKDQIDHEMKEESAKTNVASSQKSCPMASAICGTSASQKSSSLASIIGVRRIEDNTVNTARSSSFALM